MGMPRRENVTYVIYDQFHWCNPDHIERQVKGWKSALATYCFLKDVYANVSLGLVTLDYYNKLIKSMSYGKEIS